MFMLSVKKLCHVERSETKNFVILSEAKKKKLCHVERKRNICPNHSTASQQILRFAQDDKKGAQDDRERTLVL